MNYANIKYNDIANGPGVRTSLFVSGCNHHCKGCFNEIAWDFNYGDLFTEEIINKIIESCNPYYISGLTILGGEPLDPKNQKDVLNLILLFKKIYPNKTIWLYTGYILEEEILNENGSAYTKYIKDIINNIDILVDGRFDEKLKDITLKFRGSSNQRIIDIKKSLKENKIILWKAG